MRYVEEVALNTTLRTLADDAHRAKEIHHLRKTVIYFESLMFRSNTSFQTKYYLLRRIAETKNKLMSMGVFDVEPGHVTIWESPDVG